MPVLMLHSSLSSGRQWQALKRHWPGYECHTPDLLGYGAAAAELTRPFSLAQEAAAVTPWLEQQQAGSVSLIGHSYGGALALHLARYYPKQINALVLFEPVAFHLLAKEQDLEARQLLQEVQSLSAKMTDCSALQAAELFVDYWQQPGYFAALPQVMQDKMASQVWKVGADFEALISEPATLADYQNAIACPVLLMTGKHSRCSARRISELLHSVLVQSEWLETETGHMGPVSQPELVNSGILKFLADQALLT
ncbi:alpha/beta hydrolase [Rheinheimera sp.]|uniref:alpha/beta fold hydrolase n=1 Tax=Rheinheimera sp. TaxID=1869214 RepID=UPI00307D93CD